MPSQLVLASSNSPTVKKQFSGYNSTEYYGKPTNKKIGKLTMVEPLQIKHHSLTGRITLKLMYKVFREIKRNKGKTGVDKARIEMYSRQFEQNLKALIRDLKRSTFQPKPVRETYLDEVGGKLRPCVVTLRWRCYADFSDPCSSHCFTTARMGFCRDDPAIRPWNAYSKLGGPIINMHSMLTSLDFVDCIPLEVRV